MTDKFTPEFELEADTFSLFKTAKFRKFLVENKVIVTVVGFVIANHLIRLIDSLYEDILFVCNDLQEEMKDDHCKSWLDIIYYFKLTIFNYNIYIGKFVIQISKFCISVTIAFYLSRLLNDIIN